MITQALGCFAIVAVILAARPIAFLFLRQIGTLRSLLRWIAIPFSLLLGLFATI